MCAPDNGVQARAVAKPIRSRPIKVGIAEDPERRLANLQNGKELRFHRFW